MASNATKAELTEAMDTMIEEVSGFVECAKQSIQKREETTTSCSRMRAP